MTDRIWAVIPAAGVGARMEADIPKQYLQIAGSTIIEHTVNRLLAMPILGMVVCIAPYDKQWDDLSIKHEKLSVTEGGETRAHSVLNGLHHLSEVAEDQDWVMVHDAARPAVSELALQRLIDEVCGHEAGGLLAVPINDTVKYASPDKTVEQTLDRSRLWYAQTPQMFRLGTLKHAIQEAMEQNVTITDEASAIEYIGLKPKLVLGEVGNIKVTTPADMALVKMFIES